MWLSHLLWHAKAITGNNTLSLSLYWKREDALDKHGKLTQDQRNKCMTVCVFFQHSFRNASSTSFWPTWSGSRAEEHEHQELRLSQLPGFAPSISEESLPTETPPPQVELQSKSQEIFIAEEYLSSSRTSNPAKKIFRVSWIVGSLFYLSLCLSVSFSLF